MASVNPGLMLVNAGASQKIHLVDPSLGKIAQTIATLREAEATSQAAEKREFSFANPTVISLTLVPSFTASEEARELVASSGEVQLWSTDGDGRCSETLQARLLKAEAQRS